MEKKIALASICVAFTREAAETLDMNKNVNLVDCAKYIIFNTFVEEMLSGKKQKGSNVVRDVLLPAIRRLNKTKFNEQFVLFDMETLMHDEAVMAIKQRFRLCRLETDFKNISHMASPTEKALHGEYSKRLSNICDCMVDCNKFSDSNFSLNNLVNC